MNRRLLFFLMIGMGLSSCKTSDTSPDPEVILQCPSDPAPLRGFGGRGSFVMPNAFSANADGRNDRFELVCSDTGIIRAMTIRIVDGGGTVLTTLRSQSNYWDGYNAAKGEFYPAGYYRVDYGITLNGGTGTDEVLSGHTCVKLYRSDSGNCIKTIGSPSGDVFGDQIDPKRSVVAYQTSEQYCP